MDHSPRFLIERHHSEIAGPELFRYFKIAQSALQRVGVSARSLTSAAGQLTAGVTL